ncbi:DNA-processing protein DprA [Acidocella sp. MX-AZ02]|uniref:DNA-processing protein DprA n=1 Tax=Acidocella sp. MX-AZ02 TaxID=1214225 RepID=UPI00028C3171|nr:DNA-processing protein DprA [Acidocella sp. MX-AZ02]EKN00561.1 DNA protecting protein DprA [Acidocella sp. MX-AZ02]
MAESALGFLRLARTESVGPITYRRLLQRFDDPAAALDALPGLALAGGRATPSRIPPIAEIEREIAALRKIGGRFLFLGQPGYPRALAELPDAPAALAVLGDVALLSDAGIGIVGARNASLNGMRLAELLAAELAVHLPIISGLARGIDSAAHQGALRAGRTIAVIAGGLDVPYPPENADLQRRIAQGGAVVAEAPLGTAPLGRHFPKRNRIIAGLCQGLVVIEAAARSGTLLTARLAAEAGREIFAVPGSPLDPRSAGGNDLLRQGAHLTETAQDVLANLRATPSPAGFAAPKPPPIIATPDPQELARARAAIPPLLSREGARVDEIARRCQLSIPAIRAVILELELAGRAESLPGDRIIGLEDP